MNTIGSSVSSAASLDQPIETAAWTVTLRETIRGEAILALYPAADKRTRAFEESIPGDAQTWVALRVTIANALTGTFYLPPTAFAPVEPDATPTLDYLTLTPPDPDLAGSYDAGASREGWIIFRPREGTELGNLVRFLPFRTDSDPRFLILADSADGTDVTSPVSSGNLPVGCSVRTVEDAVNLRASPSTSADILAVLSLGTELVVTGETTTADGYTWYPVSATETGETGYIVGFIDGCLVD